MSVDEHTEWGRRGWDTVETLEAELARLRILVEKQQAVVEAAQDVVVAWESPEIARTEERRRENVLLSSVKALAALDQSVKAGQRLTIDHPEAQQALREEAIMTTQGDQPAEAGGGAAR